jgi:hypothetical protein
MRECRKKITFVTTSCANCHFGRFDRSTHTLECKRTGKVVPPSSIEAGAIFYHTIPGDCPFPDTDEPDQFGM